MAGGGEKTFAGVLAGTTDVGVAAREENSRQCDRRRRNGGRALAGSSVHAGGDPRVRLSAGGAERKSVEPDFADERGTRPRAARRQNFFDCGREAITGRD